MTQKPNRKSRPVAPDPQPGSDWMSMIAENGRWLAIGAAAAVLVGIALTSERARALRSDDGDR